METTVVKKALDSMGIIFKSRSSTDFMGRLMLGTIMCMVGSFSQANSMPFAFVQQRPLIDCPDGYVYVPKNVDYVAKDFCVMKYEAKAELNAGGSWDADGLSVVLADYKPSSVANDQPWRSINRNNAIAECQALGADYDLLSNAQWQTIARNLELVGENWTAGVVGSGCIFQGNNGETTCGYDAGADPVEASSDPRGILTFSNSRTIHDFSGNLWEWVKDDNPTNYGSNAFFSAITAVTHTISGTLSDGVSRIAKAQFGPSGSYGGGGGNTGLGYGSINSNAGGVRRGGYYSYGGSAGVFAVILGNGIGLNNTTTGFRCVYAP